MTKLNLTAKRCKPRKLCAALYMSRSASASPSAGTKNAKSRSPPAAIASLGQASLSNYRRSTRKDYGLSA